MADLPTSQKELDAVVESRLARARDKWAAEYGTEIDDLRAKLTAAEAAVEQARTGGYQRLLDRDARAALADYGITEEGKQTRLLKFIDLKSITATDKGDPDPRAIQAAIRTTHGDLPELFPPEAEIEQRGLDTSTRRDPDALTVERLNEMTPEEINERWDKVEPFVFSQDANV